MCNSPHFLRISRCGAARPWCARRLGPIRLGLIRLGLIRLGLILLGSLVATPATLRAQGRDAFAQLAAAYAVRSPEQAAAAYAPAAAVIYRYQGAPESTYRGRQAIQQSFATFFGQLAERDTVSLRFRFAARTRLAARGVYRLTVGMLTSYGRFDVRFDAEGRFARDVSGDASAADFLALPPDRVPLERLWYIRNDSAAIDDFAAHAAQIDIIGPQVYSIDSLGVIRGGMHPRLVQIARAHGVKLMPLVMNPGFDLSILHRLATNPVARTATAHSLAQLCRDTQVWGIQLDFENLHVNDRDAFTALAREAADSVHAARCTLSAAVVPRTGDTPGPLPYHQWMHDYWRAAYDYKALAATLDFLSYMTYAQHTGGSTPGPVAGYPWMLAGLEYVLGQGVPPEKLSLGLAGYSDYWSPGYTARTGDARPRGEDIGYARVMGIIRAAGATPRWDDRQKAWVAMWERDGVFEHAWIEDARAFAAKRGLAERYGLRGYSVWLLGLEDGGVWAPGAAPAKPRDGARR